MYLDITTGQIEKTFFMYVDFKVIQKFYATIFEILDFWWFSGGQSSKLCQNVESLTFDPLENCKKSKFQKSPHHFFVSSPKLSPDQISALLGL